MHDCEPKGAKPTICICIAKCKTTILCKIPGQYSYKDNSKAIILKSLICKRSKYSREKKNCFSFGEKDLEKSLKAKFLTRTNEKKVILH